MIQKTLKEIAEYCNGKLLDGKYENLKIKGVSTDTRKIEKGSIFIPLVGENFDAHKFINQAASNGAVATLAQRDRLPEDTSIPVIIVEDCLEALQIMAKNYKESLTSIKTIGITGSNGKTSTKDILEGILSIKYRTKKTKGNLNNQIGVPLTLLDLDEDTEVAIIEMGMDGFGQMEELTKIVNPDIAMITNIGKSHLDLLQTKENVARAKFEILDGLDENGIFIYNKDDEVLNEIILEYDINQKIINFGTDSESEYVLELLEENSKGIKFNIFNKESLKELYTLPMIGRHNMYNAAPCIIIAGVLGMDKKDIQDGLYNITPTDMRNELIIRDKYTVLNDAYKSNPNSLLAAIDTLSSIEGYDYRILVLGDMLDLGSDIKNIHIETGKDIDTSNIDQIFTIGEYGKYIGEGASINMNPENIYHAEDKAQLIKIVLDNVKENSIILIKGSRGVALEEVVESLVSI